MNETTVVSRVKEFLSKQWLWPVLCFLTFFFLDYGFRAIYHGFGSTGLNAVEPLLFTLGWSLILTMTALLLPGVWRRVFLIICIVFFAVMCLAHGFLLNIFGRFFAFSDISFAGEGAAFAELQYLKISKKTILLVVLAVLLMAVTVLLTPRRDKLRYRALAAALGIICGSAIAWSVHSSLMKEDSVVIWDVTAAPYGDFSNRNECLPLAGLYQYTFRDLWRSYSPFRNSKGKLRNELEAELSGLPPAMPNEMTGVLKGKNLLLIQLEAIDTWMLTEEAMPNLCAAQQNAVDYTQHYTPAYITAGTFNTEFIANTGLVPPSSGVSRAAYAENASPYALANLFRDAGYTANSFHGSPGTVYDRARIHQNWGYEAYYSGLAMGMDDFTMDSQLDAGFGYMTSSEPFLSFIITYSGHGPYSMDSSSSSAHFDEFAKLYPDADPEYIHAMAHAKETDIFVGKLLSYLESRGLKDNTVLVFYSDHYNYYVMNDSLVMEYKQVWDMNLLQRTPFFILAPGLEPQKIEKVTSTLDIYPTLVNAFGLDAEGAYCAGDDVFGSGGGYVFFQDKSWYDGVYYSAASLPEDENYIAGLNTEIEKKFEISQKLMLTDYYG